MSGSQTKAPGFAGGYALEFLCPKMLKKYLYDSKMIPIRSCKIGDTVLVPKIGTLRIDFDGVEYYIAQDREVLAVVHTEQKETTDEFLDL